MATLYMNPDELDDKIEKLRSFAASATSSKERISSASASLNDPMRSPDIGVFTAAVAARVETVNARADSIESCKNTIIEINSNGVGRMDVDGAISIDVPGSLDIDTPEELAIWGQAAVDANDLENVSGNGIPVRLPSGRTYDELIESIKANQGNETYANGLIEEIGPENLTTIPIEVEGSFTINRQGYGEEVLVRPGAGAEIAEVLGGVLATASMTWNESRSQAVADAIVSSVDEEGEWGRITALNAMLDDCDESGASVNGPRFGTEFLLSLGKGLEGVSWDQISSSIDLQGSYDSDLQRMGVDALGPHLEGTSRDKVALDPLSGVLSAMVNNTEAALSFLAPHGGDSTDYERIQNLSDRHPHGDNSWTDTWTGLAATASERYSQETVDDLHEPTQRARQSAVTASVVVNAVGESTDEVSGLARGRLTTILTNYSYAVDAGARQSGDPKNFDPDLPDQTQSTGDLAWSAGLTYQPKFTTDGLAGVVQQISRSENDLQELAESVGDMEKRRMTHAAASYGAGGGAALDTAIEANSATAAFLLGASRAPVEDDAAAVDQRNKLVIDTLAAASSFIPGPGEGVAQIWKDTFSYTVDRAVDAGKNAATDAFTHNLSQAISESESMRSDGNRAATVTTITQLIALGVILPEQANAAVPGLVTDQGMDSSKLTSDALDELYDSFVVNPDNAFDRAICDSLNDAEDQFDDVYQRGHR